MRCLSKYYKKPWIYALVATFLIISLTLFSRFPLSAASGITLSSSVQVSFPLAISFNVNAQSSASIEQLRLHYIVERQNYASVTSEGWAQFSPATSVQTSWVWDMRKTSIPPGTDVQYWWTASDVSGNTGQTSRSTVSFDDNRHSWKTITSDPIILEWYSGDNQFASTLMDAAKGGLQRIENNTGAIPQGQVHIYIYASTQDLQNSMLFAPQWEGGVTFEGFNTIAIGVATNNLAFGIRAVPHELTHWIVGQVTFNDFGAGLPTWLDEGLATYGEGTLSSVYQDALNFAIANNQLISLRSLSSPFSAIAQEAYISYGESNSVVTFMIQKYGKAKMVQLLNVFHQGSDYDGALEQVYGFNQDGLDALWRQSLGLK